MTNSFDSICESILENLHIIHEKNDLRYATNLDISNVENLIKKYSTTPFIQTFLKEVYQNWNSYHLAPKFTMINRTKKSTNRSWSFEFGTRKDGYRGLGYQERDVFYVTDLFSNHREYDKAIMRL